MSADTKWIVGTVLTVALALAALIQPGQSENVARFAAIEERLGALEQRMGCVECLLEDLGLSGRLSQQAEGEQCSPPQLPRPSRAIRPGPLLLGATPDGAIQWG